MEDVSRASGKDETGFMKILVGAETKEILGAPFVETGRMRPWTACLTPCIRRHLARCSGVRCTFTRQSRNSFRPCWTTSLRYQARMWDRSRVNQQTATLTDGTRPLLSLRGHIDASLKADQFIVWHKLARNSRARLQVKHGYEDHSIG